MKYFVTEIDVLQDLKNAIERYCSNGSNILWGIESNIQSKLDELKSQESHFTSKIQKAESNLNSAESALSDCESQSYDDEGGGGSPDCSSSEGEVCECKRQLDEAQQEFETYKQEIQKLETNIDRYQNAKLRFKSSLEYKNDSTVTRLLSIINKLEAYVSYTLLPTYNSNNISSTSSNASIKNVNYVYKEFQDKNVAYDWGKQNFSAWQTNLTSNEEGSLFAYKTLKYESINKILRGKPLDHIQDPDESYLGGVKKDIVNIDSALSKSNIPENIISYRAFSDNANTDFNKLVGKLYTPKGYISTALNKKGAELFLNDNKRLGRNPVMAKLYIHKGSKGAFMEGIKQMSGDGNEILLPKNSRFQVLSCNSINGIQNIELELLL